MRRTLVSSSMITSVGCDTRKKILEVEFVSGSIYQYLEVDSDTFKEFVEAPSKGTFFNAHIKDEYTFVRVA
jgi:KTSC domain-containing protein